ncbi:hypothetical protein KDA14_04515 [Candidatus Saccharibacteria bacterium]|nr:hypothetical protein [Candidatus Saccharibacteria bacterium]
MNNTRVRRALFGAYAGVGLVLWYRKRYRDYEAAIEYARREAVNTLIRNNNRKAWDYRDDSEQFVNGALTDGTGRPTGASYSTTILNEAQMREAMGFVISDIFLVRRFPVSIRAVETSGRRTFYEAADEHWCFESSLPLGAIVFSVTWPIHYLIDSYEGERDYVNMFMDGRDWYRSVVELHKRGEVPFSAPSNSIGGHDVTMDVD